MSDILLDTSEVATDTIDYVVTDPTGLTATSTRTVVVDAPSLVPDSTLNTASSSDAIPTSP